MNGQGTMMKIKMTATWNYPSDGVIDYQINDLYNGDITPISVNLATDGKGFVAYYSNDGEDNIGQVKQVAADIKSSGDEPADNVSVELIDN